MKGESSPSLSESRSHWAMTSTVRSGKGWGLAGDAVTFGAFCGGVQGKCECGGAVGVSIPCSGGTVFDEALRGDDALYAGEFVAETVVIGDADGLCLKCFLGSAEEFALAVAGEVDGIEFELAESSCEVFGDGAADSGGVDGDVSGAANPLG